MEEEELKCPKLSNGEICQAHKSEGDLRFVSYMCPLIATPKHCTNLEHSELDHEPKHCENLGHTQEPEGKVVNFLTRLRHVGRDELDASKNVMRLTQGRSSADGYADANNADTSQEGLS